MPQLIGLTLAMMVATSCLVRPSDGFVITSAVAAAGVGAAGTVAAASIGAAGTVAAATVYGGTRLLQTETGGKVLESAYDSASSAYDSAKSFFYYKRK